MKAEEKVYCFITPKGDYKIRLSGHGIYISKKIEGEYKSIITSHCREVGSDGNMKNSNIISAIEEVLVWELPEVKRELVYGGEVKLLDFLEQGE